MDGVEVEQEWAIRMQMRVEVSLVLVCDVRDDIKMRLDIHDQILSLSHRSRRLRISMLGVEEQMQGHGKPSEIQTF